MKIFNEQHEMFRQTLRSFVEKDVMPHVEEWEAAGRIPKSIWPRMGALGLLGVEYDERYGGGGADLLTTAVLHEECARSRSGSFAMAVGVHTDMASPHLYWTGSEPLKAKYLPAICRGEKLCAIAVTEPGGGSDVAAIRTRAVREGDHYVLNGSKTFITNGALADLYFVAARVRRRPDAGQDGHARLGHRRARLPGHARAGREPAGPRGRRLLRGHARLPARAPGGGPPRCRHVGARPRGHAGVRPRAAGLRRPALRQAGRAPQARGPGDADRGRTRAHVRRAAPVPGRRRGGERDLDGQALHRRDGPEGRLRVRPAPRRLRLHA